MNKLLEITKGKSHWGKLNDYIHTISEYRTSNSNYALDAAKSLVETVANTILIDNGLEAGSNQNLNQKVKKAYCSLGVFKYLAKKDDDATRKIVNSLATIAEAIGTYRNEHGYISHGSDIESEEFDLYLLNLSVESAELLACFLISCHERQIENRKRLHYDEYKKFNEYIDDSNEAVSSYSITLTASEFMFNDREVYKQEFLLFVSMKKNYIENIEAGDDMSDIDEFINILPYFEEIEIKGIVDLLCRDASIKYFEIAQNIYDNNYSSDKRLFDEIINNYNFNSSFSEVAR